MEEGIDDRIARYNNPSCRGTAGQKVLPGRFRRRKMQIALERFTLDHLETLVLE